MVKSLRVAVRGADDEGQDDWISPALPPLAMIKQARRCSSLHLVVLVAFANSAKNISVLRTVI